MSERWGSSTDRTRQDNERFARVNGHMRKVVSWEMSGTAWRKGQRIPGHVRLFLEGGGWVWFAENTALTAAFDQADSLGYDTTEVRAQAEEWVKTGKGATFTLGRG